MRKILAKVVAAIIVLAVTTVVHAQQVGAPLSKQALAVKRKAERLTPHAPISVVPIHADEEFGEFVSHDAESFTFYDVDRKVPVTHQYADVRKIKDGYGGYNSARGRHTDRTRAMVILVVALGALGGLLAAVATAKD
jgi:hypothetical protein